MNRRICFKGQRSLIGMLVLLVALAGCGGAAAPALTLKGQVVLGQRASVVDQPEEATLALLKAGSDGKAALTPLEIKGYNPLWSPDGRRIVFMDKKDDLDVVALVNADGSNRRVVGMGKHISDLAWSPDGQWLLLMIGRDKEREIYRVGGDSDQPERLTSNTSFEGDPAWSPDGSQIVFYSNRDNLSAIYVMNADGSGERRLTNGTGRDTRPLWSPDGSLIFFSSERDNQIDLYTIKPDGSGIRQLTATPRSEVLPVWSPDGSRIAYGLADDIYVMRADGSDGRNLTANEAYDNTPIWSPDGQYILFKSNRDGNADYALYLMNADGSAPTLLAVTYPAGLSWTR